MTRVATRALVPEPKRKVSLAVMFVGETGSCVPATSVYSVPFAMKASEAAQFSWLARSSRTCCMPASSEGGSGGDGAFGGGMKANSARMLIADSDVTQNSGRWRLWVEGGSETMSCVGGSSRSS